MTQVQYLGVGTLALVLLWRLVLPTPTTVSAAASTWPATFQPLTPDPGLPAVLQPAAELKAQAQPEMPATSITTAGMSVLGKPSITPAIIERVLAQYNSPAQGYAQEIYDLGVKYGIDPAFCLAFFIQESGAGTNPAWAGHKPDGTTTHNVGNIVCTDGWRCYGRFRDYTSWHEGIEDWYKLIRNLYVNTWGRTTVEDIIPKYAPAADNNDEQAYIAAVRQLVHRWREP